jgi:hypothetical protein
MDASDDGAALLDGACDAIPSVELVADPLAETAVADSGSEGLVGVAAQAPTEMTTKAAKVAPTTTDGHRIAGLLIASSQLAHSHQVDASPASNVPRLVCRRAIGGSVTSSVRRPCANTGDSGHSPFVRAALPWWSRYLVD